MSQIFRAKFVRDTIVAETSKIVFGQQDAAAMLCGALLVGGHILLEGPPGIAKTLLARTIAKILGQDFKRIQFTPDLMPSDITGVNVFDRERSSFRFVPGPIFSDIVLADEINRTPPKTQAAMLEAMEEREVTVDGERHVLGPNFFVIATQNPIELEGTFPLPEAQLDRFFFRLLMGYPSSDYEKEMVLALSGPQLNASEDMLTSIPAGTITATEITDARREIRNIELALPVAEYIMSLISATRKHPRVLLGASPRSALYLALAAKMSAAYAGRAYTLPDDVKSMLVLVLNHRLLLQPDILDSGENVISVINDILEKTPVPDQI